MSEIAAAPLPTGATFHGRYEILRVIRAGGMGAVYEVVHLETRRRRALKVMLPELVSDPDLRARFEQEATITAEIDSEHIVETFDAGVDGATGAPFLVMELLKGEDLGADLAARGRLPPDEVVALLHQAALALDKTHAAGIVHRDLKPENLFVVRRDDGSPRLKILDFGIAKVVARSSQGAKATRSMGTPLFMSPEQVTGDGSIGPRADLYALGQIAFALLVGEGYWEKEAHSKEGIYPLLLRIAQGAPEPASARAAPHGVALPPAFDAWFARATAVTAGDRFARATEMVAALASALGAARPPLPSLAEGAARRRESLADSPTLDAAAVVPARVTPRDRPHDEPAEGGSTTGETPLKTAIAADPAPLRRTAPVGLVAAVLVIVLGGGWLAFRGPSAPAGQGVVLSATPFPSALPAASDPTVASADPPRVEPDTTGSPASATVAPSSIPPATAKAPPPVKTARPVTRATSTGPSHDPTLVR